MFSFFCYYVSPVGTIGFVSYKLSGLTARIIKRVKTKFGRINPPPHSQSKILQNCNRFSFKLDRIFLPVVRPDRVPIYKEVWTDPSSARPSSPNNLEQIYCSSGDHLHPRKNNELKLWLLGVITYAFDLFLIISFWCAPVGYRYFFLFVFFLNGQDWVHELILAWLWHHFHIVLDKPEFKPTFDRELSLLPTRLDFHPLIFGS